MCVHTSKSPGVFVLAFRTVRQRGEGGGKRGETVRMSMSNSESSPRVGLLSGVYREPDQRDYNYTGTAEDSRFTQCYQTTHARHTLTPDNTHKW